MVTKLITLRDADAGDLAFLAHLYADTRREEVCAWGWPQEQQEWFFRMQFDAQRMSYRSSFPNAIDRIVLYENELIGRMLINQDADSMRLIDIALLHEQQRQGIGTYLLQNLLKQCQERGCALRLEVLQRNPAMHLYQRLGFCQSGQQSMHFQMEWTPRPCAKGLPV